MISDCKQCGASGSCKPERTLQGKVREEPATNFLAKAAVMFTCMVAADSQTQPKPMKSVRFAAEAANTVPHAIRVEHPIPHIMEEPGGTRHLTECQVPTEEYNEARVADLLRRHPNLSHGSPEHIEALEIFSDTSILARFSYGVNKAFRFAIEGNHAFSVQWSAYKI